MRARPTTGGGPVKPTGGRGGPVVELSPVTATFAVRGGSRLPVRSGGRPRGTIPCGRSSRAGRCPSGTAVSATAWSRHGARSACGSRGSPGRGDGLEGASCLCGRPDLGYVRVQGRPGGGLATRPTQGGRSRGGVACGRACPTTSRGRRGRGPSTGTSASGFMSGKGCLKGVRVRERRRSWPPPPRKRNGQQKGSEGLTPRDTEEAGPTVGGGVSSRLLGAVSAVSTTGGSSLVAGAGRSSPVGRPASRSGGRVTRSAGGGARLVSRISGSAGGRRYGSVATCRGTGPPAISARQRKTPPRRRTGRVAACPSFARKATGGRVPFRGAGPSGTRRGTSLPTPADIGTAGRAGGPASGRGRRPATSRRRPRPGRPVPSSTRRGRHVLERVFVASPVTVAGPVSPPATVARKGRVSPGTGPAAPTSTRPTA